MLFAGTTSLYSFKYSLLNDIVKKLKQRSISAGNNFIFYFKFCFVHLIRALGLVTEQIFLYKIGTSETLRNEIAVDIEKIKPVTKHVPTHLKPVNDDQFGHYLAGLIDGDGHFSSKQQVIIVFNLLDVSLAYYIKKRLGYGNVRKVKNKNAVLLIIAAKRGIEILISLINGKIRTENKLCQINKNILNHKKFIDFSKKINFKLNFSDNLENHWLAGFTDADGSFQIKIINRPNRTEIRLNFQIDQKKDDLLILIKNFLGGNIGYRKSQDTYYYGSTSFGSAKNTIIYFDKFNLLSSKYVNYLKWRKVYLLIQNRDHLNDSGLKKIIKLKFHNEVSDAPSS